MPDVCNLPLRKTPSEIDFRHFIFCQDVFSSFTHTRTPRSITIRDDMLNHTLKQITLCTSGVIYLQINHHSVYIVPQKIP